VIFSCDRLQARAKPQRYVSSRGHGLGRNKITTKGVKFWQKSIETVELLDGRPRKEVQEMEKEKKRENAE